MIRYMIADGRAVETENTPVIFMRDSDLDRALKNPDVLMQIEQKVGRFTVIGRLGKLNRNGVYEEDTYTASDIDAVLDGKGELGFYERVK